MDWKLEAVVKVTILFLHGSGKSRGILKLIFCVNHVKTTLHNNIPPHIWKLANIVHIPKPNKDIDKGTSYRPISFLSVFAKTLEKSQTFQTQS